MGEPGGPLRVLHLILVLGETNSQYNEHCLPMVGVRDLSIVTFFPPRLEAPPGIAVFPGDGTLRGFFRALRAALGAGGYDAIHAHAPHTGVLLPVALLAWGRYRRLRPSLVYTVHDVFQDYKLRNQAMMVVALAAFRRLVFCSEAAYESLPGVWKRLVGDRWCVVRNCADVDRIDRVLALAPRGRDPRFTVVSVARLERVKDPFTLLHAFAAGTGGGDRLVVMGDGSLRGAVEARIRALGLEGRADLVGLVPRDEVFRRCAAADLFVSTSRGEGLPVAVLEAMACGRPAILSDIPPHREVAEGAPFIPLVPPGDVEGFAREIARFRAMAPEDRDALGRRCREHVLARFSLPRMHEGYEAVYRGLAPAGKEALRR